MKSLASFRNAVKILTAFAVILLAANMQFAKADTFVSKTNGSWSSSSTWNRTSGSSHTYPQNGDVVVVGHTISNFNGFSVGQNGTGGMTILSTGNITSSNSITVEKGFTLYNYGTLKVSGLYFNGDNSTASNFYNRGIATVSNGLNFWSAPAYIRNSGSLTVGGSVGNGGTIIDSGSLVINGSYSSNNGKLIVGGTGTLIINGSTQLTGATITIGSTTSVAHFNGSVDLNGSPVSKLINYGSLYVGSSTNMYNVTVNYGQIYNYSGKIDIYGSVLMNSTGDGSNQIQNADNFTVENSMTTHGWSVIVNSDSMIVRQAFTNGSDFTNNAGAYLETGTDFFNQSKTNAKFTNDGYTLVKRNFTNDYNGIMTGSGGGMKIRGASTNNGTISGTQDICDSTANSSTKVDNNTGTMGGNVTSCQINYAALPVVFATFTAEKLNNTVVLHWQTASEINNSHFLVMRSIDGQNYTAIGRVEGNGNSNVVRSYSFTDNQPLSGTVYYRLKQVDYNGASGFSPIASVRDGALPAYSELNLFPNPVGNNDLNIAFSAQNAGMAVIEIYNMAGAKVYTGTAEVMQGQNTLKAQIKSLNDGLYVVLVSDGTSSISGKFRK